MPFLPGHKKLGGRQSNQITRVRRALDLVDESGVDPLKVLIDLCGDEDKQLRLQAAKELAKYVYPQQRSIELSQEPVNYFEGLTEREKLEKAKLAVKLLEEKLNGGN